MGVTVMTGDMPLTILFKIRRHSHRLGLEGRQWPADVFAIVAMDNQDFEDDVDLVLDAGQSYANGTIAPLCANSFVSGEPLS